MENEDRNSKLPDSILRHILSFLPTICCVRLSCLSKRWRLIWTSVPALDFQDGYYASHIKPCSTIAAMKSFSNFVNRVLILSTNPTLQTFRLLLIKSSFYSSFDDDSWIWAATIRNVEKLHLCTRTNAKLPQDLFNSEKLVNLVLGFDIDLNVPMFVNLPSLKTLQLCHVHSLSLSDASISRLILGCSILENFTIERGIQDSIETFTILSSSLKHFKLRNGLNNKNYSVIIDAPKLTVLTIADHICKKNDIEVRNIFSMSKVALGSYSCRENLPQICGSHMVHILKNYCINVLSANILALFKALVDTSSNKLLCCGNMKDLSLTFCGADLKILPDILASFPNLQVLKLVYMACNHAVPYEDLKEKKSDICYFNHSLKEIEFIKFKGQEAEMRLAEYFLKNAKVLHEIRFQSKMEVEVEVLKKLLKFRRCSDACEIVISYVLCCFLWIVS